MANLGGCRDAVTDAVRAAQLLDGLVAYLPLDEASGNRADIIGGSTWLDVNTVTSGPGPLTTAARLTAANSERLYKVSTPALTMTPGGDFTLAGWCYFNGIDTQQGILSKRGGTLDEYDLKLASTGALQWTLPGQVTGTTTAATAAARAAANAWHWLCAWWDASARILYLQVDDDDPVSAAATFTGEPTASDSPVALGSYAAANYLDGKLAQWGIWKRVLCEAERQYLYNGGVGVTWPFDKVDLAYGATFAASDLSENGYSTDNGVYNSASPLAFTTLTTTATVLAIDVYNDMHTTAPALGQVNVRVGGANYAVAGPRHTGLQRIVTMLAAGSKTIQVVGSAQSKPAALLGTYLVGVAANAAVTVVAPTTSGRMVVYGDSITVGANSDVPNRDGWAAQLRALRGNVMVEAWGYRALYDDCVDAAARTVFVARLAGYAPAEIWLAIGTNDYGLQWWSAANFGTAYAALLDGLHTALPSATIWCQTPITRTMELANSFGSTLPNYRTQIDTAVSTRGPWAVAVDGTAWTVALDTDGLHPTNSGHTAYYLGVKAALGL